eukprot:s187_g16.t1
MHGNLVSEMPFPPNPNAAIRNLRSLHQYYREKDSPAELAFRKSMMTMHVLYSHEHTVTHQIEELTDLDKSLASQNAEVPVFFHEEDVPANQGKVQTRLLEDLWQNRTPYLRRGWCFAERRWSKLRARANTIVVVDKEQPNQAQSAPWAPETFKEELERPAEKVERTYKAAKLDDYYRDDNKKFFYKFTHRDDFDSVMESYRKAFVAKARGIPVLEFSRLPAEEVRILARALPYYENLETIKLADRSIVNEEGAKNS